MLKTFVTAYTCTKLVWVLTTSLTLRMQIYTLKLLKAYVCRLGASFVTKRELAMDCFPFICQLFNGETAISCMSLDNFSDYSVTITIFDRISY